MLGLNRVQLKLPDLSTLKLSPPVPPNVPAKLMSDPISVNKVEADVLVLTTAPAPPEKVVVVVWVTFFTTWLVPLRSTEPALTTRS